MKDLEPYKDQPEGQTRCFICYEKRMDQAFAYADSHGFDEIFIEPGFRGHRIMSVDAPNFNTEFRFYNKNE